MSIRSGAMPNAFDPDAVELPDRQRKLVERRRALLGPGYKLFYRKPLELVRGSGVRLYDSAGKSYLDGYNNVPVVGHSNPVVAEAVSRQIAELNTNTRYLSEPLLDYAERLLSTHDSELTNIMFACSGSEANDLALRIVRYVTGAEGVVVTTNAYHGVTGRVAEVSPSLGDSSPLGPYVRTVAPPARSGDDSDGPEAGSAFAERVIAAIDDLSRHGYRTAALLVDTLLCSDGLIPDPAGFLAPAATAARERGALLICDEVQAGFGRVGSELWGYRRHRLTPDLVTMGKPIGNGLPISAVAVRGELVERFGQEVRYFNTFAAGTVVIAAAAAVLDVLADRDLAANARDVGAQLRVGLGQLAARHPTLTAVRGAGLYLAADIVDPASGRADPQTAAAIVDGMRERQVLISSAGREGDALKIRPPLPFSAADAGELLAALEDVLVALGS